MFRNFSHFILIGLISYSISACQTISNFIPTQTPYPTNTPHPTQTPYPTFTPIPPPTTTPENKILYEEDDFSTLISCFPYFSNSDARWFAENKELHALVQTPNYYVWSECDMELRNFILEVDATLIDGPEFNEYGVFYRKNKESEGFYAFLISGDGYYTMQGVFPANDYPDNYYPLLTWSALPEIKKGKETNHLKVIAIGDQFELYVNGALVGLVREGTLSVGTFGFFVSTYDEGGVHVAFDNLKITEPSADQAPLGNTDHILLEETSTY